MFLTESECLLRQIKEDSLMTKQALEMLGVLDGNLKNLPYVNTFLSREATKNIEGTFSVISIAGSPHAGKTSTISTLKSEGFLFEYIPEEFPQDREYASWEAAGDEKGTSELSEYIASTRTVSDLDATVSRLLKQKDYRKPIILERGTIDHVVLRRTKQQLGNMPLTPHSVFAHPVTAIEDLSRTPEISTTFINCLISPTLSIQRGSQLNVDFLNVLYEQYLRLHWELINYEKMFEFPRSFSYAFLDFSGTPEENHDLLFKTLRDAINSPK